MQNSSTTKTVLFVAPSAYPLGGVQTWLDYLLPGLEKRGFNAVLALTSGQHHDVDKYLASHNLANVESLNAPTGTIQGRVEALEALIKRVGPDLVVVVNIIDVYQAINNLRQRGLSKLKVATSIHGIQEDLFGGINANASVIDAVITTNRLTQKLISETTEIEPSRSLYAPYGVALAQPAAKKNSDTLTIAYAGRIEEQQKRIADLLRIFSRVLNEIENVKIIIAGSGEDMPALKDWMALESQHANKIQYLGTIKPEQVASEVYQKADVLLLTSEWETGPIVAWEAMNHNVTLVSSRYLGHLEEGSLVDDENCCLFDIGNIDHALEKIHLVQEFKYRERLNANSKTLISSKYSHETSIAAWVECFENIFKTHTKPYSEYRTFTKDNGRLTSVLSALFNTKGVRLAESIRRHIGTRFDHQSAGSEWPHSYPEQTIHSVSLGRYISSNRQ